MSASRPGKTTNSLDDIIDNKITADRLSQWGNIPGEVVSFDPVKQTATIKPLYKPRFNGKPIDMPELLEVPMQFPRTGAGAITMPIPPGSKVSLRPDMRSSENYDTTGDGSASDARSFSISDMRAHLDGGDSAKDPLPNFDPTNVHMRAADGAKGIKMDPSTGKVKMEGPEGDQLDHLAKAVELAAEGFTKLGTEALTQAPRYATIGAELTVLAAKMRGNQLT